MSQKEHKSTPARLVRLFLRSRDTWKQRAADKQRTIRALRVRIRDLTASRDDWKALALERAHQLEQLQRLLKTPPTTSVKKKVNADPVSELPLGAGQVLVLPACSDRDAHFPPAHRYPVFLIRLCLLWHIRAGISFRGCLVVLASCQSLLTPLLPLPRRLPCPSTIRSWLLRLGLFILQRPQPRRDDWIFILDHTIQIGVHKCLLILGVPVANLVRTLNDPKNPDATTLALRHQDVVILDLRVMASCTGETVNTRLQAVADRVGTSMQLLSDHGSDLACGIRLFKAKNPSVVDTYDITHRLALLLKEELEMDLEWKNFLSNCTATMQAVQQTKGSFLRPPAPRTRARYLNLKPHIDWALHVLAFTEQVSDEKLAEMLGKATAEARQWLEAKLGWLQRSRELVQRYALLLEVIIQTQEEIKVCGLHQGTADAVWGRLSSAVKGDARWASLLEKLRAYLVEEGNKIPLGKRWLGTSDVIESIFGKYKWLLEKSSSAEIGLSTLMLPLLTVEMTSEMVHEGLAAVSVENLRKWQEEHLGFSTLSKSRLMRQVLDKRSMEQPLPLPPDTTTITG